MTSSRTASAPISPPSGDGRRSTSSSRATSRASGVRVRDRGSLRAELGYRPDDRVCVVTVGGSGVGWRLLRRVIDAYPKPSNSSPACGWWWSPALASTRARYPAPPGVELHAYVDGLYRNLAACDLAVVQGGLATCMELTASWPAVPVFPAQEPLRAVPARAPPVAEARRGPPTGLRHGYQRRHRSRDRSGDRPRRRLPARRRRRRGTGSSHSRRPSLT